MNRRMGVASVGLGCVLSLVACANGEGGNGRGATVPVGPNQIKSPSGALPDAGSASCVESYDPLAVRGRAFAFDGEVARVGPSVSDRGDGTDLGLSGVTFTVREWFLGGRGDTVTVDMPPQSQVSDPSSEQGPIYGIGSRLLVSGESRWGGRSPLAAPIAWTCGFTRYYDQDSATEWRDAVRP